MSIEDLPHSSKTIRRGEPPRGGRRVLLFMLFVIYLVLLAWIVVWKLEVPYIGDGGLRQVKLVPFGASACAGASEPSEVVANVVLFLPFGVYLGLLAPTWPWWKTAGTIAGASLAVEVAQYALAVGSSDVTDLVANTAGGLAGIGVLVLARRSLDERTVAVMTRVCSGLTLLALLAAAIVVVSPLSFAPPETSRSRSAPYRQRAPVRSWAIPAGWIEKPAGTSAVNILRSDPNTFCALRARWTNRLPRHAVALPRLGSQPLRIGDSPGMRLPTLRLQMVVPGQCPTAWK